MYDEIDACGILVQRHGPHIFHTNSKEVFGFIKKYGGWINYRHQCAVEMDGIISPSPANYKTIDLFYNNEEAAALKTRLETRYNGQKSVPILELLDCDDTVIKHYAEKLYEMNYRPYTAKQWGVSPEEIDQSVLKRVPVRLDYTDAYFDDEFQCMPEYGYTHFFKALLAHENIEVQLNVDALDLLKVNKEKKQLLFDDRPTGVPLVYTGPIDEILNHCYGRLSYRSLRFDYQTENLDSFQDAPVVAYPKAEGYTRVTEYKKLPPQNIPGLTTLAYEYPLPADKASDELYYPVLTDSNAALYNKYLCDLQAIPNLFLCGRLADYKYYNMDNAILRAFEVFEALQQADKKRQV
jgi:UDP-galactopyranose mutase